MISRVFPPRPGCARSEAAAIVPPPPGEDGPKGRRRGRERPGSGPARAACGALVLVLGLAGCAAPRLPALGPAPPAAVHVRAVQAIPDWSLAGRIGLRVENRAWSGSLRWTQRGARYRIRFVGPLGQGALDLQGGPGGVELRTSNGARYRAASAAVLLARRLGWRLPVRALAYWVRGVPEPGRTYRLRLGPDGRIRGLTQAGWTLTIAGYRRVDRFELPTKIEARRGTTRVRFAVGRWRVLPPGDGASHDLSD